MVCTDILNSSRLVKSREHLAVNDKEPKYSLKREVDESQCNADKIKRRTLEARDLNIYP